MTGHRLRAPCAAPLVLLSCLLSCLLFASTGSAGDPDVAKVLFDKGDKALKAKRYEEACDFFSRAVQELTLYPEARYGLAQALEKLGRTDEATAAYAKVKEDVAALPAATRTQKKLAEDAGKAAARLGKEYAELAEIDKAFFERMMDLGRKYMTSNPQWAKKFFSLVLLVQPDNPLAKSSLDRLGGVAEPVTGGGDFEPQLTDQLMKNWTNGLQGAAAFRNGTLLVEKPGAQYSNFTRVRLWNKYAVRCSFRVLKPPEGIAGYGLLFAKKPGSGSWGLVIQTDSTISLSQLLQSTTNEQRLKNLTDFKFSDWHKLEVQIDGATVVCLLDSAEVFRLTMPSADLFDGTPGLFVGNASVEIRDMGVSR